MPTIIIAVITILLIICSILFFPTIKIKQFHISTYWIISLIGAGLILITKEITISELINNFLQSKIGPLQILVLFISMTIISIFLDEVGFFKKLACIVTKKASGKQLKLFLYLYLLTSILTVFTSNDIIILTFTPFICYFAHHAKINPLPFLVGEFIAANTWSMMLIIGNPTNIYIASSFDIDFFHYFLKMVIPTIVTGIISISLLLLIFRHQLAGSIETSEETIQIEDKFLLIIGVIVLAIATILLAISSYIKIQMWIISLTMAFVLLLTAIIYLILKHKSLQIITAILKKAPWALIPFLLSMFTIIFALSKVGVTNKIAQFFVSHNNNYIYGIIAFLSCNILNNIPMSVLFTDILVNAHASLNNVYTVIAASNIGAYLTPLGALAGIMWMGLLKEQHIDFSFIRFIKYGVLLSVPAIIVAILMISII